MRALRAVERDDVLGFARFGDVRVRCIERWVLDAELLAMDGDVDGAVEVCGACGKESAENEAVVLRKAGRERRGSAVASRQSSGAACVSRRGAQQGKTASLTHENAAMAQTRKKGCGYVVL